MAEQSGVNTKTINRFELSQTNPKPGIRQKLDTCVVGGSDAGGRCVDMHQTSLDGSVWPRGLQGFGQACTAIDHHHGWGRDPG